MTEMGGPLDYLACVECRQMIRLTKAEADDKRRYMRCRHVCSLICEQCLRQIEDRVRSERARTR